MITVVNDFFAKGCGRCDRFDTPECSARQWATGLAALRKICAEMKLVETAKWGHPCYMHADRNIAILGALRGDFRLTFFHAALLKDPHGVLEKQGPNTRHPDMIRFTDAARVTKLAPTIRAYLQEAMQYAEQGIKPPKEHVDIELPDELTDALMGDPELATAFQKLTPGRQRSYVINLNSAKASATRIARIAKFRSHIIAGKGAQER